MKITIDFEDGLEIQELVVLGASGVVSRGDWFTLKFQYLNTGDMIYDYELWDKSDNPVTVNKPNDPESV